MNPRVLYRAATYATDARSTADSVISALSPAAWYLPSDVDTLWQDTGATSPVTAAWQSVARIDDKSGNGNHLTQSTANVRPLWDGAGALNCFWATNTTSRIARILNNATSAVTREAMSGAVVFDPMGATSAPILDLGTSQFSIVVGSGSANANNYLAYIFNGASFVSTTIAYRGRKNILTWRNNGTNLYITLNGTSVSLTALSSASMTRVILGTFNGGNPKGARIHEAVVISSDIGATNQAALGSALAAAHGYAPDTTKTVMCIGDSLTAGVGSEKGIRPSDYITNRPGSLWYVIGSDGGFIYTGTAPSAANATAMKGSSEGIYHLWLGTNDINSGARTGLQTAANLKAYSDTVRAGGGKVIVYTLQDFPNNEAERLACNAQIATDSASYDAIVDLAAITELSDCTNTTYFTSDQVHLMDAGYALVGAAAQAAQAAIP